MATCPHGREINTDATAIFQFAGPVYTCACCHAHWGGYQGDPAELTYCGTCREKPGGETIRHTGLEETRYVNTLSPSPERRAEIESAGKISPGVATCSERFSMLPFLSLGDVNVVMDTDPPKKTLWERFKSWIWP